MSDRSFRLPDAAGVIFVVTLALALGLSLPRVLGVKFGMRMFGNPANLSGPGAPRAFLPPAMTLPPMAGPGDHPIIVPPPPDLGPLVTGAATGTTPVALPSLTPPPITPDAQPTPIMPSQ